MGHNVVVTATPDADAVARDGLKAGAAGGYLPAGDARVLASTKMIGGGQTATASLPGNKLKAGVKFDQLRHLDWLATVCIDMSKMGDVLAVRAMIGLLKDQNKDYLLGEVYEKCVRARNQQNQQNYVKLLYDQFTNEELSQKISEIVKPVGMNAEVKVVFQTVDNLHRACPRHLGDWYFTGHYPTPGGMKVVNRSYINYMEGKLVRAY